MDVLYSMCELNEAAFQMALSPDSDAATKDFEATTTSLKKQFEEEKNPALIALQGAATKHRVPFLWDDDCVSVGYGKSANNI